MNKYMKIKPSIFLSNLPLLWITLTAINTILQFVEHQLFSLNLRIYSLLDSFLDVFGSFVPVDFFWEFFYITHSLSRFFVFFGVILIFLIGGEVALRRFNMSLTTRFLLNILILFVLTSVVSFMKSIELL